AFSMASAWPRTGGIPTRRPRSTTSCGCTSIGRMYTATRASRWSPIAGAAFTRSPWRARSTRGGDAAIAAWSPTSRPTISAPSSRCIAWAMSRSGACSFCGFLGGISYSTVQGASRSGFAWWRSGDLRDRTRGRSCPAQDSNLKGITPSGFQARSVYPFRQPGAFRIRSPLRWCDPLRLPLLCEDPLGEIESLLDLAKSPLHLLHLTQSLPQVVELAEFALHLVDQLRDVSPRSPPPPHATGGSQLIRGNQPPGDHLGDRDRQDDEPHAHGPHGYLKHAGSPSRPSHVTYRAHSRARAPLRHELAA